MTINEGSDGGIHRESWTANPGEDNRVDVTVNVLPADSGFQVNGSTMESLTFAGPNAQGDGATWNTAQTVTVTGPVDDNAVEETVTITHTIGGAIVANGILRATVRGKRRRGA